MMSELIIGLIGMTLCLLSFGYLVDALFKMWKGLNK